MDNNSKTTFEINKDALMVSMSRVFDAPAEAMFKAYTDPELMRKWWGPERYETIIDKFDVQEGGQWRIIHKDNSGEHGFHGVFKKIDPPKLITWTFNYEGVPGNHELVETVTFEEVDGKTKMTSTSVYQNLEDLEGMVGAGMEGGARESLDRLAELVEKN